MIAQQQIVSSHCSHWSACMQTYPTIYNHPTLDLERAPDCSFNVEPSGMVHGVHHTDSFDISLFYNRTNRMRVPSNLPNEDQ